MPLSKINNGRIVFVSAYPPDRGRASHYAKTLVETMAKNYGLNFAVYTDSEPTGEPSMGVTIKPFWLINHIPSVLKLWLRLIFSKSRLAHFNLCLTTFGRGRAVNFLGLLSILFAKLSGKKVVVTLHNISETITLDRVGLRNSIINRMGLFLSTKLLTTFADAVVVLVKIYKQILERRYNAKNVYYIPHGAWFTENKPTYRIHDSSRELRVLFLGYIVHYKDLQLLGEVLGEIEEATLLISGDLHPNYEDSARRYLSELLKNERVRYLGFVKNEDLPALVSQIDAVFLPYLMSPGTSGVVHLLSGLGAPFLAFPTPELSELREDGAGIMMVKRDRKIIKKTLIELKLNKKLRAELSLKSRSFAEGRSWDRIAKEYLKVYLAVLRA